MTEHSFGLGALEPIPDERDEPISGLFAAAGIELPVALPVSYRAPKMPPVLNQGNTPRCVAFASAGMKRWQDRPDGLHDRWWDFDEARFFEWIGGTNAGAYVRTAMATMRSRGYPVVRVADFASAHKIGSYFAVGSGRLALQQAVYAFGPIVVSGPWYASWMPSPTSGVLPPPDVMIGGHAFQAFGYEPRGLVCAQTWGDRWGRDGVFVLPWEYVGRLWEAWKASDQPAPVHYRFGGRPLVSPRTFVVSRAYAAVRPRPTVSAAKVDTLRRGETWAPRQVRGAGKNRWLGNRRGDKWVRIIDVKSATGSAIADTEEV